jgi:hypothetical protein
MVIAMIGVDPDGSRDLFIYRAEISIFFNRRAHKETQSMQTKNNFNNCELCVSLRALRLIII